MTKKRIYVIGQEHLGKSRGYILSGARKNTTQHIKKNNSHTMVHNELTINKRSGDNYLKKVKRWNEGINRMTDLWIHR